MKTRNRFLLLLMVFAAGLSAQGLTIGSGSVFSLGGATLSLPNNYTDSGAFVAGAGTVAFNGAAGNQTISSVAIDTFQNLTVNKAAGNVVLNKNIAMRGNLTVMVGHIDMNNDTIKMGTTALLSETPGNTVKGRGEITGPLTIGAPSALNPFGLGATLTSAVTLGPSVISRGHVMQTVGTDSSILRYFDITPTTNTGLSATLVFHYDTSELNGHAETGSCLYRSIDTGKTWTNMGGTIDSVAHTVTLSGISAFSRWTVVPGGISTAVKGPKPTAAKTGVPRVLAFDQNYPNPFSRTTTIKFTLKDDGRVTLKVYDMVGREVATLVNGELQAGVVHSAAFDASALASGTYVCRLNAGSRSVMRKIKLVK
ncbi:MAG: T9SS type A sorting domain-containing protein [Chitinispirillaceae bacterium]|jgi:hypothetical protein